MLSPVDFWQQDSSVVWNSFFFFPFPDIFENETSLRSETGVLILQFRGNIYFKWWNLMNIHQQVVLFRLPRVIYNLFVHRDVGESNLEHKQSSQKKVLSWGLLSQAALLNVVFLHVFSTANEITRTSICWVSTRRAIFFFSLLLDRTA